MCILPFWDYTKAIGFIIINIIDVTFIVIAIGDDYRFAFSG